MQRPSLYKTPENRPFLMAPNNITYVGINSRDPLGERESAEQPLEPRGHPDRSERPTLDRMSGLAHLLNPPRANGLYRRPPGGRRTAGGRVPQVSRPGFSIATASTA